MEIVDQNPPTQKGRGDATTSKKIELHPLSTFFPTRLDLPHGFLSTIYFAPVMMTLVGWMDGWNG